MPIREQREPIDFATLTTTQMSVHADGDPVVQARDPLHQVAEEELTDAELRRLAAAGVAVVPGAVAGVETAGDPLTGVRLADGTAFAREVIFVAPRAVPQAGLLERLGAEMRESPFGTYLVIDERGLTTSPACGRRATRAGSPSRR